MKHDAFFRKHPVFTSAELDRHMASLGDVGPRARESLLKYHRKAGHVILIRRGLYAVVPPGASPVSYPVDPFLIAARLTKDAVISYHTALEIHGNAYSTREQITYSAAQPLSLVTFRSRIYRGVKFPKSLRNGGKEKTDVITVDRQGLDISVTNLERTLVDVLDRPSLSGSWEEIWRSLESIAFFDLDKVIEYALLLGNATTIAKVGFFLDQHRESLMVEREHLDSLRKYRPKRPHYLESSKRESGKLVADWNLVLPVELIERSWGEVL